LAAAATMLAIIVAAVPFSSESARRRLADVLSSRLDAEVEIQSLDWHVFPSPSAEGTGVTVRHRGRRDVPPLISVARFSATGSVAGLLGRHISRVTISGLDIQIPPDRNHDGGKPVEQEREAGGSARTLVVDDLISNDAHLSIIPDEPDRDPKVWSIHRLHMTSVGFDRAMPYEAVLTNGLPPGEIATHGSFGPWQKEEPGLTPLDGAFSFEHADLSVFKGISGILSSQGTFGGLLNRLDVHGDTDVPNFALSTAGHPVPLRTTYHAIVDGTNGNTMLERIDATLLNTSFVAAGGVIGHHGQDGRTITLDVKMAKGRLEDVLALAVKSAKPPMTGSIRLDTKLLLPPGEEDIVKKLRLNGHFVVADTRFSDLDVQEKIDELSHRGRGRKADAPPQRVAARFTGAFNLTRGTLALPDISFDVPGSTVRLAGSYDLLPETLAFRGTLLMDAKVSETQTGVKHLLLKVVDPLFARDGGGSEIPIRIEGTRTNPSFGLDKGRVLGRR
jgi:hypothetical protein